MRGAEHGVRLTVYIGEGDTVCGRPAYRVVVQRARAAGLAGATVTRGVEGFGASAVIHTTRLLSVSEDLPVVVQMIDTAERIEAFLPVLYEVVGDALVVREPVDILRPVRAPA